MSNDSSALTRPTMVLNRHWSVIGVETVKDSIRKIFCDTRHYIDPLSYLSLDLESWLSLPTSTPSENGLINAGKRNGTPFMVVAPEIVICTDYADLPKMQVRLSRRNILIRDNYSCQYCGVRVARSDGDQKVRKTSEFTLDHVLPKGIGGASTWDNLVTCCYRCNNRKAMRTPEQAGLTLLSIPKKPKWTLPLMAHLRNRPSSWNQFLDKTTLQSIESDHAK